VGSAVGSRVGSEVGYAVVGAAEGTPPTILTFDIVGGITTPFVDIGSPRFDDFECDNFLDGLFVGRCVGLCVGL